MSSHLQPLYKHLKQTVDIEIINKNTHNTCPLRENPEGKMKQWFYQLRQSFTKPYLWVIYGDDLGAQERHGNIASFQNI